MKKNKKLYLAAFLCLILTLSSFKSHDKSVFARSAAYPGGGTVGIKLFTDGLLVVGIADIPAAGQKVSPAKLEGIKKGDIITHLNGEKIESAVDFSEKIQKNGNAAVAVTVLKKNGSAEKTLTPVLYPETGEYKLGMWVRDSAAGIGTVTFILPDGSYGALGHGISDIDTGDRIKIESGEIVGSRIVSVLKGSRGAPGELRGMFTDGVSGTVDKNTDCGIFGTLLTVPDNVPLLELGTADDAQKGEASIYSNIEGEKTEEFSVLIEKIQKHNKYGQNMVIKVTDPRLLRKTGGIVQGMSGSPIIQNGRIIGAVTHVFLDDPERGYGIFIENMLGEI
ncbi:MAG: SpoIVB peptidase [Clostridia bacterium]|nr:SpoIVB peptidase [Clostridia bacterium]